MWVKKSKGDSGSHVDVQASARSLATESAGMAEAISECARLRIASPDDLRKASLEIFNVALESSQSACKTLAVFVRRLHDRYPRFTSHSGGSFSLGSAMYELCQTELSSVHELVQATIDEASVENIPIDVNSLRQPEGVPMENRREAIVSQTKAPDEVERSPSSPMCLQRLDTLQIFSACLYTQDVVPEDFVHKILDSHRFSSLSWPAPARHVGIMSACDMMMFCGKRLEKLGSLCHVMPDWYSYLRSLQQDLSFPRVVHDRIAYIIRLRENQWVPDTTVTE